MRKSVIKIIAYWYMNCYMLPKKLFSIKLVGWYIYIYRYIERTFGCLLRLCMTNDAKILFWQMFILIYMHCIKCILSICIWGFYTKSMVYRYHTDCINTYCSNAFLYEYQSDLVAQWIELQEMESWHRVELRNFGLWSCVEGGATIGANY